MKPPFDVLKVGSEVTIMCDCDSGKSLGLAGGGVLQGIEECRGREVQSRWRFMLFGMSLRGLERWSLIGLYDSAAGMVLSGPRPGQCSNGTN